MLQITLLYFAQNLLSSSWRIFFLQGPFLGYYMYMNSPWNSYVIQQGEVLD